jgi:hypothetical protein
MILALYTLNMYVLDGRHANTHVQANTGVVHATLKSSLFEQLGISGSQVHT